MILSEEQKDRFDRLTEQEKLYFQIMNAQYGVLYITAKPGVAKSAIAKSIADKMGYTYIDMRLTMNDESDFKFPHLTKEIYKDEYGERELTVTDFAIPRWAFEANTRPTIIHFEELNRAPQFVRNAALQILLEREIGSFKFNENVLMISSGNLGVEDGTDVEEFDSALNNRLIHIRHELTKDAWIRNYAKDNVHSSIVKFLDNYPDHFSKKDKTDGTHAYASPRSWTMLSRFITKNWGMDADIGTILPILQRVAVGYVGVSARKYLQYCEELLTLNINHIINDYENVKGELRKFNREKRSELIQTLREIDIRTLEDWQIDNVVKFLRTVSPDELTGYLVWVLDSSEEQEIEDKLQNFLAEFCDVFEKINTINDRN